MKWFSPNATKQILLSGQSDMDEDKLMAWYPEYKTENDSVTSVDRVLAGQVNLVSYEKKKVTLYLVPVNGSTCPDAAYVQKTLNAIYAQAVVEFDVKRMDNLQVTIGDSYTTTIDNTDNDERMNYTPDEKTVIGALEDNANYTSDAYYLFFFDGAKDPSLKGYMPLKKQYGFIFKFKQYPDEYLRTVAHETGHGVFRLYHTFSDQNKYFQTQGASKNLMDYSDASALSLYKYQWDWVHDPSFKLYWFEKAEEAESMDKYYSINVGGYIDIVNRFGSDITYIAPDGSLITLLNSVKPSFTGRTLNNDINTNVAKGCLLGFNNGKSYLARFVIEKDGFKFNGYFESNTGNYFTGNTSTSATKTVLIGREGGNCSLTLAIGNYTGAIYKEKLNKPILKELLLDSETSLNPIYIIPDCQNTYAGKAKDFRDYCRSTFDTSQYAKIDETAAQIQTMGEMYLDYEKISLANNPYTEWVNTKENLDKFYQTLLQYQDVHKNALKVDNPNCKDCPQYPVIGDSYWDDAGRNWLFTVGNSWHDLSGEFCNEEDCNSDWKLVLTTEQIQIIHQSFYNEKLTALENDGWQRSLGINDEFRKNLWRATQLFTVHYLKEKWVAAEVGDSKWNILFGNAKKAFYNAKVANGDQSFYAEAAFDGVFVAADVMLLESVVKNVVWKFGIKYLIIEGGAKQLSKQIYYTACKKAITLSLSYTLKFGTPDALVFFNKQLPKTIEIYDMAFGRYIKFDPATGETLAGKFISGESQSVVYESYGKIAVPSGLTEAEQAKVVASEIAKTLPSEWTISFQFSWKPSRIIKGNINKPIGVIGVYDKTILGLGQIQDTKQLVIEMGYRETIDITYSQNGIKVLNTPKNVYVNGEQFWVNYNEPWLKGITDAKADVAVLSDPADDLLKYQLTSDGEIKMVNGQKEKTGFGKEIDYMENLVQQGKYKFDKTEGVYKYIGN